MKLLQLSLLLSVLFLLNGCATMAGGDAPSVRIVGLNALPSEGLELRFALKLRVQNPNENALAYDGLSVKLDLDGRGVASGVSNETGEIPRFSDKVLTVPVSISAFAALRQFLSGVKASQNEGFNQSIVYSLKGKLGAAAGSSGATRFSDSGEMDLFSTRQDDENEQ